MDMEASSSIQWERKLSESDFPTPQLVKRTDAKAVRIDDYQVFLSFRGLDTRYDFTDVLYENMKRVGICVFKDDDEIPIGEQIDIILQAIKTSEICVPIFSKTFASSAWCLREVEKMVDLGKDIMPIFYRVNPEDVKLKTNLYEHAMMEHEAKHGKEQVEKWKYALRKIVKIKGMEVSVNTRYTEFCKRFINEVLRKLKPRKVRYDSDHLVGMESQVESVMKLLDTESHDVPYIGIHGMGGIGKTTLVRAIFTKISVRFDCSCFLENVRESSLEELTKKLREGLLPRSWKGSDFLRDIEDMFHETKVLVVLDDVDKKEQVEQLTGRSCWFGFGTRIIVTSRNTKVLEGYGELHQSFEMKTLKYCQALELFKWHAFRESTTPSPIFEAFSRKIVSDSGGLPLAIEVMGSRLYNNKDENVWREVIARSKKLQDKDIKERLRISYDALEHDHKQIFLDIACLPVALEEAKLFHMWENSEFHPHWGIAFLRSMSLVKIINNNEIWMHDQLRDLGKNIVREENIKDPRKRSRLWDDEEAREVLLSKEGKKKVEILCVTEPLEVNLTPEHFASFKRLRYLKLVSGADVVGDCRNLLPNLAWLSCHLCRPNFNATMLYQKKLVMLDFSHSLMDENWGGWSAIKALSNLKSLDLSHCHNLRSTPFFPESNTMKRLVLRGCSRLRNIHGSIAQLKGLEYLDLDNCDSLRGLPEEIGSLDGLKEIVVIGSPRTRKCTFNLPTSIGNLRWLVDLRLLRLRISEIPDSIGHLESLIELDISGTKISELPNSIGRLGKLEHLWLCGCSKLKKLPDSIGDLKSLIELDLAFTNVSILPDTIGYLHEMNILCLNQSKIKKLPRSIGMLKKLLFLDASHIPSLEEIPMEIGGLSSLERLRLDNSCISTLPSSIKQLLHLQHLQLNRIDQLQELPELPSSLVQLCISGRSLRRVPDFSNLSNLIELQICDVDHSNLKGIDKLTKLERLKLSLSNLSCTSPFDLGSMTKLKDLSIFFPAQLGCINALPSTSSRLVLNYANSNASATPGMKLLDLPNLNLEFISFHDFSIKEGLEQFGIRELLVSPQTTGCISNCVTELCLLKNLSSLRMDNCRSIQKLPNLSQLKNLKSLEISSCQELVEIPGLGKLESLASLEIYRCESLERLENLSKLEELSRIILIHCPKLRSIEGTDRLCFSFLMIDNCKSLRNADELKKRTTGENINKARYRLDNYFW